MEARVRHLLSINRVIAESLDYEGLLELVVEKTAELARADACALLLSDEAGIAYVRASRGIPAHQAKAFAAPLDERINVALRGLLGYREDDTFLGAPVIHAGRVRGILVVHREGATEVDADEEIILAALADQAAIALDHASRYRQLWLESEAAQRELERASRHKDEFLAMLSHELRNPLAAIANAHEVLRRSTHGDSQLERATAIASRQAAHMRRLLDDLLDVSRVSQGKIALVRRPVVVQDLVQQALQAAESLVGEREHHLLVDLPPDPVVVDGDAERLVQVISNLLVNAARFTAPGGHLKLSVRADGGQALLRVEDDGIGIAPDLLPSIFDLFVQAGASGEDTGGLGIGLSLVKRLAEMHGGSVEAASAGLGRGSEFLVRLPLGTAADRSPSPARAVAAAPTTTASDVLLVEDNEDVSELLAEVLAARGHQVRVARDGEQALAEADRRLPDVMLVDIGLPGMDGYELARQVRSRNAKPPLLVALTGYGSHRDRERAQEAGFDHHLVKPVQLEQLERLLAARD